MRVLRNNRDSLIALLQAFIYDPLINWRLLAPKENVRGGGGDGDSPFSNADADNNSAASSLASSFRDKNARAANGHRRRNTNNEEDPQNNTDTNLSDADASEPPRKAHAHDKYQGGSLSDHLEAERNEDRVAAHKQLQHASHKPLDQAGASLARRQSKIVQMQADANVEVLNQKALDVLQRVHDKLTGMDFAVTRKEAQADAPQGGRPQSNSLSNASPFFDAQAAAAAQRDDSSLLPAPVALQVQRLIVNATLSENLAQAFSGWCGTW
jgi:phosphatidylinositol kinase/protein kinase (PI-3  family)